MKRRSSPTRRRDMAVERAISCLSFVVMVAGVGCSAGRDSREPATASEFVASRGSSDVHVDGSPQHSRGPEGVVMEVAPSLPIANAAARLASGSSVLALSEPIPDEAVRDVLFSFFEGLRRRDADATRLLFSDSAVRIDKSRGHEGDREAMLSLVAQWMRQRDATKIVPSEIVVPERIDRYDANELAASGQRKPEDMAPFDLLIRLAAPPPRPSGEKLFEDSMLFVLRPEGGRVRIVTVSEEPN